MPNRLARSTSPYLLQHKDNPVDWWEWQPEAFAEARERNVPILLSVGYSACHWCHVMAHESFENIEIAALMNQHFVNIKVDREERPDVDAVYMTATQALTGRGGWPMTVFLDHDGRPFYAGTYYPPEPRHGMPSFPQLLVGVSDIWRDRRTEAISAGERIQEALRGNHIGTLDETSDDFTLDHAMAAVDHLVRSFDVVNGGFGGAPKFPPAMALEFLLRVDALRDLQQRDHDPRPLLMVNATCEAMARGGMYDQLGGGFARYSVDAQWTIPHFEKMLYDNALLLDAYTSWWLATGAPTAARVVRETAEFLIRDMRTPEGGFASALDADTDGVEGLTYSWTPNQLVDVLGDADGEWFARAATITDSGTFEHGMSVVQRLTEPDDEQRWNRCTAALFEVRQQRPQPGRDDKIVAAWNGLAITALARAGAIFGESRYVDAALAAADLLVAVHLGSGSGAGHGPNRLVRVSRDGIAGAPAGQLDDQACVAQAFLTLHQVTAAPEWLSLARALLDGIERHFLSGAAVFDTADDAEELILRPSDLSDNATPSGRFAAADAFLTYAALSGDGGARDVAERLLRGIGSLASGQARFVGRGLATAVAYLDGPREVAVVTSSDSSSDGFATRARRTTAPGAVVVVGSAASAEPGEAAALLENRPLTEQPTAYICRGFVCDAPVTDLAELTELLRVRVPGSP